MRQNYRGNVSVQSFHTNVLSILGKISSTILTLVDMLLSREIVLIAMTMKGLDMTAINSVTSWA
jgi:hypothetical protein